MTSNAFLSLGFCCMSIGIAEGFCMHIWTCCIKEGSLIYYFVYGFEINFIIAFIYCGENCEFWPCPKLNGFPPSMIQLFSIMLLSSRLVVLHCLDLTSVPPCKSKLLSLHFQGKTGQFLFFDIPSQIRCLV